MRPPGAGSHECPCGPLRSAAVRVSRWAGQRSAIHRRVPVGVQKARRAGPDLTAGPRRSRRTCRRECAAEPAWGSSAGSVPSGWARRAYPGQMRVHPAPAAPTVQREWIDEQRSRPRVQVKVVEGPQHRFAMGAMPGLVLPARCQLPGHRVRRTAAVATAGATVVAAFTLPRWRQGIRALSACRRATAQRARSM